MTVKQGLKDGDVRRCPSAALTGMFQCSVVLLTYMTPTRQCVAVTAVSEPDIVAGGWVLGGGERNDSAPVQRVDTLGGLSERAKSHPLPLGLLGEYHCDSRAPR